MSKKVFVSVCFDMLHSGHQKLVTQFVCKLHNLFF